MMIKIMSPLLLLLLCLLLSFGLYSQGYGVPWLGTDHERCIDRCHETEEEFSGLLSCLSDCQRKYGEEEWGRQGRDQKSPQEEFEQCQEQCQWEERGQRQQQRCQQRCEKQMREKEREQEQQREHQQGGRGEDPQQQYRHCQQRCQRQEQGQQQQQRCQRRCEEQLREEQEQKQEREERDPKQQLKQCLSQCEEQEQSQQGLRQCQQRCEELHSDLYYRVFSNEVLKTALNTPRDQLERLFGQQSKGFIIRATQEQLQALSQHASSARQQREEGSGHLLASILEFAGLMF